MFQPYYTEGSSTWNHIGSEYILRADGRVLPEMMQLYQEHMLPSGALPYAVEEEGISSDGGWNAVSGGVGLTVDLDYYKSGAAQLFCAFCDGSGKLLSVSSAAAPVDHKRLFHGPSATWFLLDSSSLPLPVLVGEDKRVAAPVACRRNRPIKTHKG